MWTSAPRARATSSPTRCRESSRSGLRLVAAPEAVRVGVLRAQLAVVTAAQQYHDTADQGEEPEQACEQAGRPVGGGKQIARRQRRDPAGHVQPRQSFVEGTGEVAAGALHAGHPNVAGRAVVPAGARRTNKLLTLLRFAGQPGPNGLLSPGRTGVQSAPTASASTLRY